MELAPNQEKLLAGAGHFCQKDGGVFFMASDVLKRKIAGFEDYISVNGIDEIVIEEYIKASNVAIYEEKDVKYGLTVTARAKEIIRQYILDLTTHDFEWLEDYAQQNNQEYDIINQYYEVLGIEAMYLLDSYALYIEKNRPKRERFYEPRRKTMIKVVEKLQALEDDELDELFIHMSPRVGKSQMMTIYMGWHCARDPEKSKLYCTYKESLGGAFLEGITEIWTDPTYCHNDIFPDAKIVYTDAKNHKIDLKRRKKYKSVAGKGLESGLNGEYDANGVLAIDDIIEGIQDVLNPDTLRRKQIVFDNNLMSRAKSKCKIIYNGTIWSLHDIFMNRLDFLQNNPKAKHIRWEVLKIPALDPDTDESNFDYDYGVGFDTEYYQTRRAKFEENDDLASWYAQYQQEPIERDGAVFNPESMRFYNGILPSEEPLKVMSACDVALGGGDYLSMPVAYVYENGDCYIHDVVFDNQEKDKTQPQVINAIINNKITSGFFESNQGGEGYKDDIDRQLKEMNYKISLISKYAPTKTRKEQRIWDNAPTIRQFIFRDVGCRSPQYRKFMTNLYSFTINGKNKNDDAADSLSQLADFMKSGASIARVEVIANPFRTGGYGSYGNF
jgi:predicted phage terminase large subunit-like protein